MASPSPSTRDHVERAQRHADELVRELIAADVPVEYLPVVRHAMRLRKEVAVVVIDQGGQSIEFKSGE